MGRVCASVNGIQVLLNHRVDQLVSFLDRANDHAGLPFQFGALSRMHGLQLHGPLNALSFLDPLHQGRKLIENQLKLLRLLRDQR